MKHIERMCLQKLTNTKFENKLSGHVLKWSRRIQQCDSSHITSNLFSLLIECLLSMWQKACCELVQAVNDDSKLAYKCLRKASGKSNICINIFFLLRHQRKYESVLMIWPELLWSKVLSSLNQTLWIDICKFHFRTCWQYVLTQKKS